jgi:hypothetical protein
VTDNQTEATSMDHQNESRESTKKVPLGIVVVAFAFLVAACASSAEPTTTTVTVPTTTTTTLAPTTTTTLPPTTTTTVPPTTTTVQAVSAEVARRVVAADLSYGELFEGVPAEEIVVILEGTCALAEDYQSGTEFIFDMLANFGDSQHDQKVFGAILFENFDAENYYGTRLCESEHANMVIAQAWEYVAAQCAEEACEEDPAA